ncbi:16S rRNA (guanine(527)-N(7))-methyltransferase RsmG [Rhizobium sp. TRM95796]|uniref:16S rRNA (guanine(527)-N(7))-methyltransferase RsmG n=1 Tax=Rhizobium sp. TRM95796 TaxID=2979862 RepID=UPI0021E78A5C|nr:16S rRNA (guanine(527)-N(7))-methyltransferase RsmG [Rhizobium sp. TRM95796]MCV3767262.1 16S rRNA (guanine(527)-N(7))-methyltransferase RsmG [Rhizobium sp. TRM95796]
MQKSLRDKLIGMGVSRETLNRLETFADVFAKWAAVINLVAPSTKTDLWERHILDSAQLVTLQPNAGQWVDLGSGGGFPGIVTAIFLAERGDGQVHLVESNHKKAAFLRAALSATNGRGTVHAVRIETAPDLIKSCDFLSARALAELDILFDFAEPWASRNPDLVCYLHKGRDYRSEVEKSRRRWSYDLVKHTSIVEPDSVVLEIRRLQKIT